MKKKILCVILARGGSKSIPKKNISIIDNHPLISYSIQAAKDSNKMSRIVVSTDDKIIAKIANEYGAETPFLREKRLSGDKVPSMDALRDCVLKCEKHYNELYDYIIELPCVSPLRDSSHINSALKIIDQGKFDSVVSYVCTGEKHPIRLKRIKNNKITNFCREYPEPEIGSRRQDFEDCFIRNGAIYCMTRECIVKDRSRMGKNSYPLIMNQNKSVNIDEKFDLEVAKLLIENGNCNNKPKKIIKYKKNLIKKIDLNKKNILITAPITFFNRSIKNLNKKFNCIFLEKPNKELLIKNLKLIDGWICQPSPEYIIDQNILKHAPKLKIISTPSTGITHIDQKYCKKNKVKIRPITVSREFKDIKASSEFTFLLCLLGFKNLIKAVKKVKSGYWRNIEETIRGNEVIGKSIGIFGQGRIGSNLSKYFESMGAKVRFYDVKNTKDLKIKNLILKKSDMIVMCISYNKKNYNYVNSNFFSKMKKNSIFVNTSRGEILDETSLLRALRSKKIRLALLDVLKNEQTSNIRNKLIQYSKYNDNLIITPHMAGLTYESESKAFTIASSNIHNYFLNEKKSN